MLDALVVLGLLKPSVKPIDFNSCQVGVVFANISGPNLALDHHRFYPFGTLWSNISLGAGSRPFLSGGLTPWGGCSASFTTFYNVTADARLAGISQGLNGFDWGPNTNLIGMRFGPAAFFNQASWKEVNGVCVCG
jgi:hypothetical protein